MITSFEAGAKFTIIDEATPAIMRMVRELGGVSKEIDNIQRKFTDLGVTMKALGVAAKDFAAEFTAAMASFATVIKDINADTAGLASRIGRIAASTTRLATATSNLAAAQTKVQTSMPAHIAPSTPSAARAPGAPNMLRPNAASLAATRSAGGGGRGTIFHGPEVVGPLGMRGRSHGFASAGGILGLLGIGDAIEQEAIMEDTAVRAMITSLQPVPTDLPKSEIYAKIRDVITSGAIKTGFSIKDVSAGVLGSERFLPGMPFMERMDVERRLMPYVAAEARLKHTGFEETFEALLGVVHQTGAYKPDDMEKVMNSFIYASTITPLTLPQFAGALSYTMPVGKAALDIPPEVSMMATAMMNQMGIRSTRSGTWQRSFWQRLQPAVAPEGGELSKAQVQHNRMLQDMGLWTGNVATGVGTQPWMVKGDYIQSFMNVTQQLAKWERETDPIKRSSELHNVFMERGLGFAALWNQPQFMAMMPEYVRRMQNFKASGVLEEYSSSPIQQARVDREKFQVAMSNFGEKAMPVLTMVLEKLNTMLDLFLAQPKERQQGIIGSILGGLVGNWIGDKLPFPFNLIAGAMGAAFGFGAAGGSVFPEGAGLKKGAGIPGSAGARAAFAKGWQNAPGANATEQSGLLDLGFNPFTSNDVHAGVLAALQDFYGGSTASSAMAAGGGGGGGGVWGNGGIGLGGFGFGAGGSRVFNSVMPGGTTAKLTGVSNAEREQFYRNYVTNVMNPRRAKEGLPPLDPEAAIHVMRSEGERFYVGDHGTSFTDFQLHFPGVGSKAMAAGIDPRDASQWQKSGIFAMEYAARNTWKEWTGARNQGIYAWPTLAAGQATAHPSSTAEGGSTHSFGHPASPYGDMKFNAGVWGSGDTHVHISLDGEKVGHAVLKRAVHKLHNSTLTNQGQGQSTMSSPFASGIGVT